jgi:hypothetical protein
VDEDSLNRKRAAFLLRQALGADSGSPPWSAFLELYELLEEFAAFLVKAGWGKVATLRVSGHEHQRVLLRQLFFFVECPERPSTPKKHCFDQRKWGFLLFCWFFCGAPQAPQHPKMHYSKMRNGFCCFVFFVERPERPSAPKMHCSDRRKMHYPLHSHL